MQEHTERTVWGLLSTLDKPVNMLLSASTICMASHDQRMEPVRPEGSTAIVETLFSILLLRREVEGERVSGRLRHTMGKLECLDTQGGTRMLTRLKWK